LGGAHQRPPPAPVPLPQPSAEATPTGLIGPPRATPAIGVPTMASATADPATRLRIFIRFFFPRVWIRRGWEPYSQEHRSEAPNAMTLARRCPRKHRKRRYRGAALVCANNWRVTARSLGRRLPAHRRLGATRSGTKWWRISAFGVPAAWGASWPVRTTTAGGFAVDGFARHQLASSRLPQHGLGGLGSQPPAVAVVAIVRPMRSEDMRSRLLVSDEPTGQHAVTSG
jgi:hypothetical protein